MKAADINTSPGKKVYPAIISNPSSFVIRANKLRQGIYFYKIISKDYMATRKLIICE